VARLQQAIARDDSREEEKTADNADSIEAAMAREMKKEVQKIRPTSVSDKAEEWRLASLEFAEQTASIY
jgi:hypothetical protein